MNNQTKTVDKKYLYFAGGWFNAQQEEEHTRLGKFLSKFKFLKVFNPRIAGGDFKAGNETDGMTKVLLNNINAICDADVVVVITDHKDMGTLWESGFAYAMSKPIIYYCETLGDKPFNLMLAKTGLVAKNEDELEQLLNDAKTYAFKQTHIYGGVIE